MLSISSRKLSAVSVNSATVALPTDEDDVRSLLYDRVPTPHGWQPHAIQQQPQSHRLAPVLLDPSSLSARGLIIVSVSLMPLLLSMAGKISACRYMFT